MQIFLKGIFSGQYSLEVEVSDTYDIVVEKLIKAVDDDSKRSKNVNPLITTNPLIFFDIGEKKKEFKEGMKLENIKVSKETEGIFNDNMNPKIAKLRPIDPSWASGMDSAKKEEYDELERNIRINKQRIGAHMLDLTGDMGYVISQRQKEELERQNEELERQIQELQSQIKRKQVELHRVREQGRAAGLPVSSVQTAPVFSGSRFKGGGGGKRKAKKNKTRRRKAKKTKRGRRSSRKSRH